MSPRICVIDPKVQPLEFDPIVFDYAPFTPNEQGKLEYDIHTHGQRDAASVWRGRIIDGRSRYQACLKVGKEFRYVDRTEELPDEAAMRAYVESLNERRRSLTHKETFGERRKRVGLIIGANPNLSDRELGERASVDHKTIAAIRKELGDLGNSPGQRISRRGVVGDGIHTGKGSKGKQGGEEITEHEPKSPEETLAEEEAEDLNADQDQDTGEETAGQETSGQENGKVRSDEDQDQDQDQDRADQDTEGVDQLGYAEQMELAAKLRRLGFRGTLSLLSADPLREFALYPFAEVIGDASDKTTFAIACTRLLHAAVATEDPEERLKAFDGFRDKVLHSDLKLHGIVVATPRKRRKASGAGPEPGADGTGRLTSPAAALAALLGHSKDSKIDLAGDLGTFVGTASGFDHVDLAHVVKVLGDLVPVLKRRNSRPA
jgi:hypothetical protein